RLRANRDGLGPARLGQRVRVAGLVSAVMKRHAAVQVGQRESRLTVAAVGRADQGEEYLVLRDGKQRSVAKHPACGGEVATEHSDFTDVWLCHVSPPLVLRREDAL